LNNALTTARDLGVPLPLTSLVQQILVSLIIDGKGENDHSAIATFFEKMARVEIRSR
jgi:2-hydroxy-3-oxopropionate reductase